MNPKDIKAELIKRGIKQIDIAKEIGTYPSTINLVITGISTKSEISRSIREHIAYLIGLPVDEIWTKD